MKKLLCLIICSFLICASICPIFALNTSSGESSPIGNMERVTGSVPFDFEIVSVGRDSVTAAFVSTGRIADPPYVGIKGTKTVAEKTSALQYVLNYDTEYSFVYTVTEGDVKIVYNSFITVETDVTPAVVFGDVIKNVVDPNSTRGAGQITETEPNDTAATADLTFDDFDNYGTMDLYNSGVPSVATPGDTDYWKVTFSESGTANFWLGNIPSGCDYDISLFNENGQHMGSSANYGQTDELIQANVEAYKTYYIAITSYGAVVSTSQYLFRTKNYPTIVTPPITPSITLNFSSNVPIGTKAYIYRENDIGFNDMKVPDGVLVTGNSISIQSYSATWDGASETNNITIGKSYAINIVAPGKAVYVIHPFTIPSSGNYSIDVTLSNKNIIFSSPFPTYTSPSIMSCQNYGYRYNNVVPAQREFHNGIDISKNEGEPIHSISDGIVTYYQMSYSPSQEEFVNVSSGSNQQYFIQYVHLKAGTGLPVGTAVTTDTIIGKVGTTGNVDAHLHIRTDCNSVSVDPNSLFY